MKFHEKHLPTFHRYARATWAWYRSRDVFEKFVVNFFLTGIVVLGLYLGFFAAPTKFPTGAYITVPEGATLDSIGSEFEGDNLVTYARLLEFSARILGSDKHIPAGVYYFPQPENSVEIAIRLVSGDFETTPVKVTVPEGDTVAQIADLLAAKIPNFNRGGFLSATQGQEGYLFPDTYFFLPGDSTQAVLSVFTNDFQTHIAKLQSQITALGKPLPEVVTMASIVEKEAPDTKDREMIAGILWHRIAIGMPLQVDVTFPYFLGKSPSELTSDDLKIDSPYNTFINKGLPPTPIDNPSFDALTAAATPTKTSDLYYLSDKNGTMHYAATYAQFLVYKKEYLGT